AFVLRGAPILAPDLPRIGSASLNLRAVVFALLAAIASGVLVSIAPISIALGKQALSFGADSRRAGTSRRTSVLQSGFVVAELAVPPDDPGDENNFDLLDHPVPSGGAEHVSPWNYVTGGFFRAIGIKLLEGRTFTVADSATGTPVILVSRSWAAHYFPGERAV